MELEMRKCRRYSGVQAGPEKQNLGEESCGFECVVNGFLGYSVRSLNARKSKC